MNDLETVSKKFRGIRERIRNNLGLKAKKGENGAATLRESSSNTSGGELMEGQNHSAENTSIEMLTENSLNISDIRKQVGYLLPLTCGHNGNLNAVECLVFEKHLRNMGFLK